MYVSDDFDFICENSFGCTNIGCENLWIKLSLKLAQIFLVGVVYCHTNANNKKFTDHFNDAVQKINVKKIKCVILRFWEILTFIFYMTKTNLQHHISIC